MSALVVNNVYNTLFVRELHALETIVQTFDVSQRYLALERIQPHLYIKGSPSGDLRLLLKRGGVTLSTITQSVSSIISNSSKTLTSYHGFVSFVPAYPVILTQDTYTLELDGINGYAHSSSHQIGWIHLPDDRFTHAYERPLALNLTEIK